MSREEFMRQLEALLTDISEEEKREALSYYRSYFEDAGEENEERILKELESPQKVAATINKKSEREQQSSHSSYEGNQTAKILLIVVLALATSPIWGSLLTGLLGSIFGITVGVVATAGALYISGGVLLGIGIGQFAVGSLAVGFALVGAGMLVWAIAVLLTILSVWVCGKAVPWGCRLIGRLWRSIFHGKERAL